MFCLLSHGVFTWLSHSSCLWSIKFLLISLLSSVISGWLGFACLRLFLLLILESMWGGMGFSLLLILPLGMNILSAVRIVSVMNFVSWCILSAGVWFLSVLSIQ